MLRTLVALAVAAALSVAWAADAAVEYHEPADPLPVRYADPVDIDPEILCAMNELAYNWSIRAQPERAPLVSSFDALRLGSFCNQTRPSDAGVAHRLALRRPQYGNDYGANAGGAVPTFYVDPANGNDSNPGTIDNPFQTIFRAVGATRAAKATLSDPSAAAQIVLRQGTHSLLRTLELGSADSGLTIANFPGETPEISMGVALQGLSWEQYDVGMSPPLSGWNNVDNLASSDNGNISALVPGVTVLGMAGNASGCQSLCQARPNCSSWTWHDSSQGSFANACLAHTDGVWQPTQQSGHTTGQRMNVWSADVSHLNLKPFSQLWRGADGGFRRQHRARFPSANQETFGLWTAPETGWLSGAAKWAAPAARAEALEVDIGAPINNGTHFPGFPMGVGGPGDGFFYPPRSYWTIKDPVGGGGSTYRVPSGFVWEPTTWTSKEWKHNPSGKGLIVGAYQGGHWGSWIFEVDSVDPSTSTVTFGRGGFQEARGSANGGELYIENVLEELDSPGEWFFDSQAQRIYYYPNSTDAAPAGDPLVAAQSQYAIRVMGSQKQPVRDVTISGITFAHSDATYLEDFYVPSSGDFAVHRKGVITAEGVENLAIENNLIRGPGGNAIVVAGYARNVTIAGNEIVWAGESGILILGDCYLIDCTNGDQPRDILVTQNLIHEFGIYNQQSAAVFIAKSANVDIDRLVTFNAPRQGTVWNDGAFGGHTIRDSALYMTVRSTGDCGPIYAWHRTVYVREGEDGNPTTQQAETTVTKTVALTNWHGVWPIDLDDGSAYINATGNVLAWGGYKNYLGHSKTSVNNVYVYPDAVRAPPPPIATTADTSLRGAADSEKAVGGFFTKPFCANSDGQSVGQSGWGEEWANNTCFIHSSDVYEFGSCSVDNWQPLVPLTKNNRFYTDDGTAQFKCGGSTLTLQQWQAAGEDLGSTVSGAASVETIVQAAHDVLEW